jgi:hypothetical protein
MPWTMWQALAGYLGSNATVSQGESGETVFIAEASDWVSIGFTSKLFLEGLRLSASLPWMKRFMSLGQSSSLMPVWPSLTAAGLMLQVQSDCSYWHPW